VSRNLGVPEFVKLAQIGLVLRKLGVSNTHSKFVGFVDFMELFVSTL